VDNSNFLQETRKYLREHSDPQRAQNEKKYLYSDLKHYGLNAWKLSNYIKLNKAYLSGLGKKEAISLVKLFWEKNTFEERMIALLILNLHEDKFDISDMPIIEKLMRESKGWVFLDNLIIPLMPHILIKNKKAYKYLNKWIKDKDFWVRRSAILAQNKCFSRGMGGNLNLHFDLIKSQLDEDWIDENYKDTQTKQRARFFIRKAIGWSLREISAKKPEEVYKFLINNKHKVSGLTFKEASRKLPKKYQKLLHIKKR